MSAKNFIMGLSWIRPRMFIVFYSDEAGYYHEGIVACSSDEASKKFYKTPRHGAVVYRIQDTALYRKESAKDFIKQAGKAQLTAVGPGHHVIKSVRGDALLSTGDTADLRLTDAKSSDPMRFIPMMISLIKQAWPEARSLTYMNNRLDWDIFFSRLGYSLSHTQLGGNYFSWTKVQLNSFDA